MRDRPLAYFITFTTYGTWLHGDSRKSIIVKDRSTKVIEPSEGLYRSIKAQLKYSPIVLNSTRRKIALATIRKHCSLKKWSLFAAHVRTNHVHIIIQSTEPVEKVMKDIKAWCTRRLRESGLNAAKVWTRHGSTKYVFTEQKLLEKIHYVIFEQGSPMAYYLNQKYEHYVLSKSTKCF